MLTPLVFFPNNADAWRAINLENAMGNEEEWWAAVRKWTEFWRKVNENQMSRHSGNSLNHERGAAQHAGDGQPALQANRRRLWNR